MIAFLESMLAWYNLIYTLPLMLVALYLILHFLGTEFGTSGEPAVGEIAFGGDGEPHSSGRWQGLRRFLHLEEVPLMFLVGSWGIAWGILGNAANYAILQSTAAFAWYAFPLSIPVAFIGSLAIIKCVAEILVHLFPAAEHPAISLDELIGRSAVVLSARVDARQGRARAKDAEGNPITIFCSTQATDQPRLGDEVILIDYDPDSHVFEVEKMDAL